MPGATRTAPHPPDNVPRSPTRRGRRSVRPQWLAAQPVTAADGLRYVIHDAPAKETFRSGSKVVVFGAELDTVDSGQTPAMTPNFVHRLVGTRFVDATYADGPANGKAPGEVAMADMRAEFQKMSKVPARG
ncbi:hypothetical protein ACQSSU_30735 [Micromonospora echinospora]